MPHNQCALSEVQQQSVACLKVCKGLVPACLPTAASLRLLVNASLPPCLMSVPLLGEAPSVLRQGHSARPER